MSGGIHNSITRVIFLLTALFSEFGTPLVLKCDNGSGFIDHRVAAFLTERGVHLLFSPPGTPRYNGACEAGIGSMKTRALHIAASNGRPANWTCDDIEGARLQANETARPNGPWAPSPDQMWNTRAQIDDSERRTFGETMRMLKAEAYRQQAPIDAAQVDREVLTRALLHHGLLRISRRRYPQPISRRFRAMIA